MYGKWYVSCYINYHKDIFSTLYNLCDVFLPKQIYCNLSYIHALLCCISMFYIHCCIHILLLCLTIYHMILTHVDLREHICYLSLVWMLWLVHWGNMPAYYFHDIVSVKRWYTANSKIYSHATILKYVRLEKNKKSSKNICFVCNLLNKEDIEKVVPEFLKQISWEAQQGCRRTYFYI